MSRRKIILISSLSVLALTIITVLVISIINREDNIASRGKKRTVEQNSSPTKMIERDPIDVIGVDSKTISGTLTVSECLAKSKKNPIVFYLLEETPKKDANVDAVIVFYQGKVVTFDKVAISARYEDRSIGALLKINQTELIQNLKEERTNQVKSAITMLYGGDTVAVDPTFMVMVGLYQKKALTGKEFTEETVRKQCAYYFCKETPVDSNFQVLLYTDDSGNNTEREIILIPDVWQCNNEMYANEEMGIMVGRIPSEMIGGYIAHLDVLTGCSEYNPNTNLKEWSSAYMGMRDDCEEAGILLNTIDVVEIDATQTLSGTIYDSEYIGFSVPGKGTMIAICEPETAITVDIPDKARENSSIIVDPKQEQYNEIKYEMAQDIYNSVDCVLDIRSVAECIEPKLNRQFAEELIQEGHYEWAYMLLDYLGLQDVIIQNKYERAMQMIAYEMDYDLAYLLLDESGHHEEIEANKYLRAKQYMKILHYEEALELLTGLTYQDSVELMNLCEDEIANCFFRCDYDSDPKGALVVRLGATTYREFEDKLYSIGNHGKSKGSGVDGTDCLLLTPNSPYGSFLSIDIEPWVIPSGRVFDVSFDARSDSDQDVCIMLEGTFLAEDYPAKRYDKDLGSSYNCVSGVSSGGQWVHCEGKIIFPANIPGADRWWQAAGFNIEQEGGDTSTKIYIDNLRIKTEEYQYGDYSDFLTYWGVQ